MEYFCKDFNCNGVVKYSLEECVFCLELIMKIKKNFLDKVDVIVYLYKNMGCFG